MENEQGIIDALFDFIEKISDISSINAFILIVIILIKIALIISIFIIAVDMHTTRQILEDIDYRDRERFRDEYNIEEEQPLITRIYKKFKE